MATEKKYGSGGRKQFVRTRVPAAESFASAVILLLLGVITAVMIRQGKHFDPNRFAVRAESLKSTSAAVVGKAGTAPSETAAALPAAAPKAAPDSHAAPAVETAGEGGAGAEGGGAEGAEGHAAAPAAPVKGEPLEISLPGTKPMSDTEFYNADNLFEKIDGRSPAYQNYNVQQLRCRSFAVDAAAGSYVDLYEYRFDNPVDAFGMFSLERDPQGKPLDFAPDGYSGAMGYFFRQGAVYVQIIASDQKPATLAVATALAQNRAKTIPVDDAGLAGRRRLPSMGLIPDSVVFVPENAQGQSALKDVFQARYKFNGAELPFFIMVASPGDAAAGWQSFLDFCTRFGKAETLPEVSGARLFRAQLFGKWKVVYQRGEELGGAFDTADPDQSRAFIEKYLRGGLKGVE
jgi:hypothetical protein